MKLLEKGPRKTLYSINAVVVVIVVVVVVVVFVVVVVVVLTDLLSLAGNTPLGSLRRSTKKRFIFFFNYSWICSS